MHVAVEHNRFAVVEKLVAFGADVFSMNSVRCVLFGANLQYDSNRRAGQRITYRNRTNLCDLRTICSASVRRQRHMHNPCNLTYMGAVIRKMSIGYSRGETGRNASWSLESLRNAM